MPREGRRFSPVQDACASANARLDDTSDHGRLHLPYGYAVGRSVDRSSGRALRVIVESFLFEDALHRGGVLDHRIVLGEGRRVRPARSSLRLHRVSMNRNRSALEKRSPSRYGPLDARYASSLAR